MVECIPPQEPLMPLAKFLIVDDHEQVRKSVRTLICSHSDWEVCGEAADGLEAVRKTKDLHPDVVLMDISMPQMDGLEATRLIQRETPEVKVIIISQNDPGLVSREAAAAGASTYVAKSELGRKLITAIDAVLDHRSELITPSGGAPSGSGPQSPTANLLAAIVDSSDDAIVSKDLRGFITSWNKGAERIFGYSSDEAVGQHITLIIPEDRRSEENEILSRLHRGERVDHFQTVRRTKSGTLLNISITISPLRDATGRIVGASKVARDITEQARAVQALRESEERFRAIVETTPECVKLVAFDGTLLHMNVPGLKLVGASDPQEVLGKSIYDLIAPEDRARFKAFNEAVCRGERGSLEFDIVGLRGDRRSMETHAAPMRNADGITVQLAITRDITERKRAQEREQQISAEAAAANAKFRAVFEQTTQFAGIMTKDGTMIDANRLCLEACGYQSEDVLGRPFWETAWWRNSPESQEKIRAATPRAAQGTPYREILRYSLADGTERLVDFVLYPIVDSKGEVIFLHPTGIDITDQKRAEQNYRKLAETLEAEVHARTRELENRNAEVIRQSELLRVFSQRLLQTQDEERRHMARELHDSAGQTLTVLSMNLAQLMHKAARRAPEFAADAEKIQESVQQLHREIRTTSYLLHPPLLDESGLSSALSWYVQGLVECSGLDITLEVGEEFGRLPREMELAIFRLVQESLTNIHRHSGSKTAHIHLSRESRAVVVKIDDEGKGMSQDKLAELQSGGSGVGIRGMRERLRQFNGTLTITSKPPGTQLLVTVPLPRSTVTEPPATAKRPAAV
jgi:PAS domain S-box-containing protein